ncbi:MAG: DUF4124 domain-containing protein [Candidatus Polarisedimenticolaceae bacterium]|nr:DUF4124 domain-containing protein [Candidatus Polarisedimenticolaceae bacterium]
MTLRLIPLLLVVALPLQAGVYKWNSDDGVVHYSDVPHKGAVEMVMPAMEPAAQQDQAEDGYTLFEIEVPTNEQTFRGVKGEVPVALSITPALQEGHVIRYFVDGRALTEDLKSSRITLKSITMGSHSLKAQIIDDGGNTIKISSAVRFHLRQAGL